MTVLSMMVRVDPAPLDAQIGSLYDRARDAFVEVGAYRRWAGIGVDRDGPTTASAVVSAIADCCAAGLHPIDVGPDEDLVTVSLIAVRSGCHPHQVLRWTSNEGFPHSADLPGGPSLYRWGEVAPWIRCRAGIDVPDPAPVLTAANWLLRIRQLPIDSAELRMMLSLLDQGG